MFQVKGRIAKTVEEKVSEYRQERQEKELRRSVLNVRTADNESVRRENGETDSDTFSSLPHSLSESLLTLESNKFDDAANDASLTSVTTPSTTPPQAGPLMSSSSNVSRSGVVVIKLFVRNLLIFVIS